MWSTTIVSVAESVGSSSFTTSSSCSLQNSTNGRSLPVSLISCVQQQRRKYNTVWRAENLLITFCTSCSCCLPANFLLSFMATVTIVRPCRRLSSLFSAMTNKRLSRNWKTVFSSVTNLLRRSLLLKCWFIWDAERSNDSSWSRICFIRFSRLNSKLEHRKVLVVFQS